MIIKFLNYINENRDLGFTWIEMKNLPNNSYNGSRILKSLKGKTILIYQYNNGKYIPYNFSQKIIVKDIDWQRYFKPYYKIVDVDGNKIELKMNDRIKIIGNKKYYKIFNEDDPYGEEDWD